MTAKHIGNGVLGGLAGGLVFGILMAMMGMLPMIASMVGSDSAIVGFGIHLIISAIIGTGFVLAASALGREHTAGVGAGLAYGSLWWILGPLTLMPLGMGMGLGVNWTITAAVAAAPSLMGHLIFGAVLGATYRWLENRAGHGALAHQISRA